MGKAIPAARKAMAGVYGPPGPLAELVRPVAPRPPAASAARPGGTSNRPGPPLSGGSSPVHPRGTREPPRVPSQRPIARASPPNAETPFWVGHRNPLDGRWTGCRRSALIPNTHRPYGPSLVGWGGLQP